MEPQFFFARGTGDRGIGNVSVQTDDDNMNEDSGETEPETSEINNVEMDADTSDVNSRFQGIHGVSDQDLDYSNFETYSNGDNYNLYYDNGLGFSELYGVIEISPDESFQLTAPRTLSPGGHFRGWYVERLSDGKWYCHKQFMWVDAEQYLNDPDTYELFLYLPGDSYVFDDSWQKNGGDGSNYLFHGVRY